MWDYRSQATVAEETLRRKAEKKLETLKHNLQVSQNDCQSLDAILAHVRASLQVCVCLCVCVGVHEMVRHLSVFEKSVNVFEKLSLECV